MKKFLTLALAALFAGNAMAMDNVPESGLTWVGFAGMTVSNVKSSGLDPKVGVTFGVELDYMLPNAYGTYISTGLGWVQKGARDTFLDSNPLTPSGTEVTKKLQLHYIQLPIHVGYRYNFSNKLGIYGEFGPYFAFGITGKGKYKYEDYDDTDYMFFGKHYEFGNQKAIQRFDCGFGFRVGAEFKNMYSLNISYDWGLTDMYTDDYRKNFKAATGYALDKMKNRNLAVTFGYRF